MKTLFLLTFSILLLPLSAQEEKELTPIDQLLKLIEFEESVITGGEATFGIVEKSLEGQGLNKKEMAEVKEAFMNYMGIVASDPKLKAKTKEAYEQTFTEDEILDLIAFYQTSTGKKTIHALPTLMQSVMATSQEIAQLHVGSFQKALTDIIQRKDARLQKEEK